MAIIKCPACGAKLNKKTPYCEYCGNLISPTSLNKEQTENIKRIPEASANTVSESIKTIYSTSTSGSLFSIIFAIIWTTCCIVGGILSLDSIVPASSFFSIVPFGMSIIGIIIIVTIIKSKIKPNNIQQICELIESNNFNEAYTLAKQNKELKIAKILIGFYLVKNYDEVKEFILIPNSLNPRTITQMSVAGKILSDIYAYYSIKPSSSEIFNNNNMSIS